MLEVRDLEVSYGRIAAVRGVSLDVAEGEIVAVVGPNGAGKSSLLWALTGIQPVAAGSARLDGEELVGSKPEAIARRGISLVPEDRHVFASLTVADNLRLGATMRKDKQELANDLRVVEQMFPVLREARDVPSGRLSGGQQQQLVIGRALLARPRLLLLDEPSLGLDPQTVQLVFETLATLREHGLTMLLVEQNVALATELADRSYVLQQGQVADRVERGSSVDRDSILQLYLGSSGSS